MNPDDLGNYLRGSLRKDAGRKDAGWSLMELVVVLAIIAILAAIITPMVNSYVERARVNSAQNDVRNIGAAIIQFNNDTRHWPIYQSTDGIPGGPYYTALESPVGDEAVLGTDIDTWTTGTNGNLQTIINQNSLGLPTTGRLAWNGAYMNDIATDPWGTRYYVNIAHLAPDAIADNAVFVLSAGPDKTIDTEYIQSVEASFTVGGDDIVHRIQ